MHVYACMRMCMYVCMRGYVFIGAAHVLLFALMRSYEHLHAECMIA